MIKKTLISLILLSFSFNAFSISAKETVNQTIKDIVKVVASMPGEANTDLRRSQIENILQTKFDFKEMSKRSIGISWNSMTESQKDRFSDVFSKLLCKSYINKMESITNDTIKVLDEQSKSSKVSLVKTEVNFENETTPIDYKLYTDNGIWRVYDVIIENIGLVSNYRKEYEGILRKDGIDSLISQLETKVN